MKTNGLHLTAGKKKSAIDVRISNRIIELFSEGLYSSPNKAIEELVANSFDAGANKVEILLSPELYTKTASIAVIDDGDGMDETGLKRHWLIGVSNKRALGSKAPKGRKQIGKFGIGKLATYVLAKELTHISKTSSTYHAASIDYRKIERGEKGGLYTEKKVSVPYRVLAEAEAQKALAPWISPESTLKLFGGKAANAWTVSILSDLKPMAAELRLGRLKQVLTTAMPLRDDFRLFVNGDEIRSRKLTGKKLGPWVLGKDIKQLPKPAPEGLEVSIDKSVPVTSPEHFGLNHPKLGRITGYVEVYDQLLTTENPVLDYRSYGFFVYVHGRLVNIDDEYFGIDRNLLRHGTFARFRMVVSIDRLDRELRSSREAIREGELLGLARKVLHAAFNYARTETEEKEAKDSPGARVANRVAASPASLTRVPLFALVKAGIEGRAHPKYTSVPELSPKEKEKFISEMTSRQDFIMSVQTEDLSQEQGIAVFDASSGVLRINSLHPFVAHFLGEYQDTRVNLPLELLATSEVLTEAHLYQLSLPESVISDIMGRRDDLLRYLVKSSGKRNANVIANDFLDSLNDKDELEKQLIAAFDSMGFNAIPKGGKGKPDGIATANIGASNDGTPRRYKVSLEAKSKETDGAKVSAKSVGISSIARQRNDFNCDHAVVIGPDFPTSQGESSALYKEVKEAAKNKEQRTITLIKASDFAKLIRIVPLKRIGLDKLRVLFNTCNMPEDSKKFIDELANANVEKPPYKEILETIAAIQEQGSDNEPVEYAAVVYALKQRTKAIQISKGELIELCKALTRMAPGLVFALENSVELNQRPDKVIQTIEAAMYEYSAIEKNEKK